MDTTTLGEKIMYLVTTILAAAGISTSMQLFGHQPRESQAVENVTIQQEPVDSKAGQDMMNKSSNQSNASVYTFGDGTIITITPGEINGKLSGPITIKGSVPGSASTSKFTIRVVDPFGKSITNNSISSANSGLGGKSASFSTSLNISNSSGGTGTLQIRSDHGDYVSIPVEF